MRARIIKRRWPDIQSRFLAELYDYFASSVYDSANRDVANIIMSVHWTNPVSVIHAKYKLSTKVKKNVEDPSFDRKIYGEAIELLTLWQRGERVF